MGWLQKTPLVSLLFAVAIAAVPFLLAEESPGVGTRVDNAREEARAWFERNPQLEVDSVGELKEVDGGADLAQALQLKPMKEKLLLKRLAESDWAL